MALLADSRGCLLIKETDFYIPVHVMAEMTTDASCSILIHLLPAWQKNVEVIVEILVLADIRVAL